MILTSINQIKRFLTIGFVSVVMIANHHAVAQSGDSFTSGEVRKVDLPQSKITIRHEEIKNLDMPPMTMIFTVKNNALLKDIKAGDHVKFIATSEGGKLFVIQLKKEIDDGSN